MKAEDRVEWIDIARGVSIIMVMLIHSCTNVIRRNDFGAFIIYYYSITFAVPLMLFLAGCSMSLGACRYRSMRFVDFLKKKAVNLIVPYLSYTIIIYLIFEIMNHMPRISALMENVGYGHMELGDFIIGLLIGNNQFSIHVWFLYTLFIYEIIAFVVFKYIGNNIPLYILTLITVAISVPFDIEMSLAWNGAISGFIYFAMGIALVRKDFKKTTVVLTTFLWAILFVLFINWILTTGYDKYPLADLIPIMAIIVVTFFSKRAKGKTADIIKCLGQRSMALYLFQQPFFGSALGTILFSVLGLPAYLSVIICIIASFVMPLFIRFMFVRYGWFRFLFGIK